jgi:hypothetical protein
MMPTVLYDKENIETVNNQSKEVSTYEGNL